MIYHFFFSLRNSVDTIHSYVYDEIYCQQNLCGKHCFKFAPNVTMSSPCGCSRTKPRNLNMHEHTQTAASQETRKNSGPSKPHRSALTRISLDYFKMSINNILIPFDTSGNHSIHHYVIFWKKRNIDFKIIHDLETQVASVLKRHYPHSDSDTLGQHDTLHKAFHSSWESWPVTLQKS